MHNSPLTSPKKLEAKIWKVISSEGGSSMLIKNAIIDIISIEALADLDNNIPRVRATIGYNTGGKIILLTIEGDNNGVSDGFALE